MAGQFKYWAFISYSHADEDWAKWLHKALETYRVPVRLVGTEGPFGPRPRRLFPVFRDRDELSSAAELSSVIEAALRESRYQIVICSPNSARSQWVDAEIRRFKSLGREHRVLALIVDGEPHAENAALECFPQALRYKVDAKAALTDQPSEPIAADARPFADHKHGAQLKLIAGLLGVGYDELRQRERQRRFWARVQQTVAGIALCALLAGVWAWFQQRELRLVEEARLEHLVHLGRQELREQRNARAAVYFAEALRGGRDDPALRYWLARAMQPVDAVLPKIAELKQIVVNAALTADGQRVLALAERRATLRSLQDGSLIRSYALPFSGFLGPPLLSPTGRHAILTGSRDANGDASLFETIIVDLETGTATPPMSGFRWPGIGTPFSPDGARVILGVQPESGGTEKSHVLIRSVSDGRLLARLDGPDGIAAPSFSPDGRFIVAGGEGPGEIRIWDGNSYALHRIVKPRQKIPHSAYWTGRGHELMSINEAGAIKLWDGDTSELLDALGSHSLFAMAVAHAGDGRYWLTSSIDGTRIWDLDKGQAVLTTDRFGGLPSYPEIDARGSQVLAVESSGTTLWNVAEQTRTHYLDVHAAKVASQHFVDNDRAITQIAGDGAIRWIDTRALAWPHARLEHGDYVDPVAGAPGVRAVTLRPDGAQWITGGADGTVRQWAVRDGAAGPSLRLHDAEIQAIAVTSDGRQILSGDSAGRVASWNGQGSEPAWVIETGESVSHLRLSPGNKYLVAGDGSKAGRLIDTATGTELATLDEDAKLSATLPFDETGRLLDIGRHGQLQLRTVLGAATQQQIAAETAQQVTISDVSWIRSGKIVQSSEDGTLGVIKLPEGERVAEIDLRKAGAKSFYVRALASSADQRWVAAGTLEGAIVLWRIGESTVRILEGHSQAIADMTFSPKGDMLASASQSGEIIVWWVDSAQILQRLGQSTESVAAIAFDPSGTRLLSSHRLSNVLRLWDVTLEQRSYDEIARKIACAVPWRLAGSSLLQHRTTAEDCMAVASAQGGSMQ